jgi:hypothetical protein
MHPAINLPWTAKPLVAGGSVGLTCHDVRLFLHLQSLLLRHHKIVHLGGMSLHLVWPEEMKDMLEQPDIMNLLSA